MECLCIFVELSLQLLVFSCGSLAVPVVLFRAVLADKLHITVAVLVNSVVSHSPESRHRADAAKLILCIHHYHAVATAGEIHAAGAAHAIHESHGGFTFLAAVVYHHLIVVTTGGLTAGSIDYKEVADHLRDGVGIHDLVTEVLGAIRAAVTVACHRSVNHDYVDDLVILLQFLAIPAQVILDAMDVTYV